MAQLDGIGFISNRTVDHLHAGGDETHGRSSSPMAPSFGKGYDYEDDHNQPVKKSVLARVKEKARKWRQTLSKKKQGQNRANSTPAWGVSLEEDDEDDTEYHGATLYEAEIGPEDFKDVANAPSKEVVVTRHPSPPIAATTDDYKGVAPPPLEATQHSSPLPATQNPSSSPVIAEKHVLAAETVSPENVSGNNSLNNSSSSSKTISETVTNMLAPAYNMVTGATETVTEMLSGASQKITSKIQGQTAAAASTARPNQSSSRGPKLEKARSVKEYLMQKLEPGDEERALSRVISDVMAPKVRGDGETGVVGKMKGAVSSLLGIESSPSTAPASNNPNAGLVEEAQDKRLQASNT